MANQVGAMGPSGSRVGQRLRQVRQLRGLSLRLLASKLGELGRPIDLSALAKIEKGQRRIDVDDLIALALALDVSPNWLLFPEVATHDEVELTVAFSRTGRDAWHWAVRDTPAGIATAESTTEEGDQSPSRSNFWFLQAEWPDLYDEAARAETFAYTDPRISCICSRTAIEMMLLWLHQSIGSSERIDNDTALAALSDPAIADALGPVLTEAKRISRQGNAAVHGISLLPGANGIDTLLDLHSVMKWFVRNHSLRSSSLPDIDAEFDYSAVTQAGAIEIVDSDIAKNNEPPKDTHVAEAARNAGDNVQFSSIDIHARPTLRSESDHRREVESRARMELILEETGWIEESSVTRDYIKSSSDTSEHSFIDYVLWGDDNKPLALVEIMSKSRDTQHAFNQLRMSARDFEAGYNQLPFLFCANGSDVYIWDETSSSPRQVEGFFTKEELYRRLVMRSRRRSLDHTPITELFEIRDYQNRIIRDVCNAFEKHGCRRAIVSMPVGTGRLHTCAALIELLTRAGWVNRILFLADKRTLADQASAVLQDLLPDLTVSNNLGEPGIDARIFIGTHHALMSRSGEAHESRHEVYGHGYFDLVITGELAAAGHRTYRRITDYFDALTVGFTSVPSDQFDETLESFTDRGDRVVSAYSFHDAVAQGFLVAPEVIRVRINSDIEDYNGSISLASDEVVDSALKVLIEQGIKSSDGRLGKSIIFTQNASHAQLIAHRFRVNYPDMENDFALPVTSRTFARQTLKAIEKFRDPYDMPRIAISSGVLDSGVDLPGVVNIVFFKSVNSKALFWQMLGIGARREPGMLADGQPKQSFRIFDLGDNVGHLL